MKHSGYWSLTEAATRPREDPRSPSGRPPRPRQRPLLYIYPSEFQAYRSANALKEILADYRGEAPNLNPVHLLAHSMGNIVAAEAMRQWAFDIPFNDDPLVTNYVAMEGAVSAGAWGDNATDSRYPGRPVPDLYRFWSHGRDGFSDPSLGLTSYLSGADFSAENMVNMYNEDDYALSWWDYNNISKEIFFIEPASQPSAVWSLIYEFTPGDGENTNNDTFLRINPVPNPDVQTMLTLTEPNGRPGPNAYEILAFFSESASLPIGVKSVARFNTNIDIEQYGMLHGSGILANHSYQFNHDAAETWDFYSDLMSATQMLSTHDSGMFLATANAPPVEARSNKHPIHEAYAAFAPYRSDTVKQITTVREAEVLHSSFNQLLLLVEDNRPLSIQHREALDEFYAQWIDDKGDDNSDASGLAEFVEPLLV